MPVSRVFEICNAYESGVGHGVQADGACNPYEEDSELHEAYGLGYEQGIEMKLEDK